MAGEESQDREREEADRLVARFQAGDREAFAGLYKLYVEPLFNYLRVVLKNDHDTEDATQEVFARALEALPKYEMRGAAFEAWLFKVARNHALDLLAQRDRVEPEDPAELDRLREANGETEPPLEEGVLKRLSDLDLLIFIQRMPLLQRQVVVMRFMLDMSVAQIARELDRSPDSIRQAQRRAAKFLRERFINLGKAPKEHQARQPVSSLPPHAEVLRHRRFILDP